jgi:hypothetical protein
MVFPTHASRKWIGCEKDPFLRQTPQPVEEPARDEPLVLFQQAGGMHDIPFSAQGHRVD